MEEENELVVNVERETIRGRVCPVCGGKIIPSDRAVYQAAVKGDETFPLWQCERCGYEEMARPQTVDKGKH
jgi:DNA-directed RNA polymerase subunit M/transcription elongation factor TFIIS